MQINSFNAYSAAQSHKAPQFGHVVYQTPVYKDFKEATRTVKEVVGGLKTDAKVLDAIFHDHHNPETKGKITTTSKADDQKIVDALKKNDDLKAKGVTFFVSA